MTNPWLTLPSIAPYVLPQDRRRLDEFNARLHMSSPHRFDVQTVIPEPFVGAVHTARVLVLQLNPGHDPVGDPIAHAAVDFRAALFGNLRHSETAWPFYFFDPRFREAHPGGRWWVSKTKKLAEVVGLETLGRRLAVVEWFPYKSQGFKPGCTVPSQEYAFALVAAAVKRGALIVISRSVALWEESVPALQNYPRRLTLSSTQNVAITPNNVLLNGQKSSATWEILIRALAQ